MYIYFLPGVVSVGAASNWSAVPPPLFRRVVLVLIDALRQDFVFGPKGKQFMPYATQVIEKGTSYSFVAEAKPPTVTMPRIKVSAVPFPGCLPSNITSVGASCGVPAASDSMPSCTYLYIIIRLFLQTSILNFCFDRATICSIMSC